MKINKIVPDVANVLLVFYQVIKKDRPNLEGERLYETILQTWNLNLSTKHIELKELMEKAKHLDWGQDLNLRKIAWALAMGEYLKEPDVGATDSFNKDAVFIIKMRDQIGKIIPEGI